MGPSGQGPSRKGAKDLVIERFEQKFMLHRRVIAPVRDYGEVLAETLEGEAGVLASRVVRGAEAAVATIARLQRIVRFEETTSAGQPMLDLDASTDAAPPARGTPDRPS